MFIALSMVALACGSNTGSENSADLDADTEVLGTTESQPDDPLAPPTIDIDGPVDPEVVRQTAASLIQADVDGTELQCLIDDADGDTQLTGLYNGFGTNEITPEGFTALSGSVYDCVPLETLATSFVPLIGATDPTLIGRFTSCVSEQLDAEPNGDLTYTGLSAILVGLGVPEGAQPSTIEAATACVPVESIVDQMATSTEQASGFASQVDRECVADNIDEAAISAFWEGLVQGTGTEGTVEVALETCTSDFSSGLPTEVPASFVPWAGEGTLSGVDPFSRADVYDGPPPNQLVEGVDYQAVITTQDGEIVVDLFEDTAPITVNSFVSLARDGFYDQTRFHRVLDGFMAQAGDPTATGSGGPGFSFDDEASALTPVDQRGLLAMANSGPNTNGSQFFITFEPATHLNGLHAVFGEVVTGEELLDQIERRDPAAPSSLGEELISVEILEQ